MASIDTGYQSLVKHREELCGDSVEIIGNDDSVTMVLADGLGSGVKANILSTLTSKIIGTMMANGLQLEDAVATIAQTLPVCSQRKIAYSTFSILQIKREPASSGPDAASRGNEAVLIQFDNPDAVLLRNGKSVDYATKKRDVYGKVIYESRFEMYLGDALVLISDGVVHAGVGKVYNFGWQAENVRRFLEENYQPSLSASALAKLLCDACRQLYMDMPGDDATVAVLRLREECPVSLMIGPPLRPEDDEAAVTAFLRTGRKRVVCGGTTSQIVARYLGEDVITRPEYIDPAVPPIGFLKGIDLVTEGVLTLSRADKLVRRYNAGGRRDESILTGSDGASTLARLLLVEATSVQFFVGRALNPAYCNRALPGELNLKMRLVRELARQLKKACKKVSIRYY